MLFNSYLFIFIFLPVTYAVFFLLARKNGQVGALLWLIAASLIFYGWWNPIYVLLLLGSTAFNYYCGNYLLNATSPNTARLGLTVGVAANLLFLAYFKYMGFFAEITNTLFGTGFQIEKIFLPLAISFFTFQQIAYLVDAYKQEVEPESFYRYCLFISFFPALISGPISHHKELMPQFNEAKVFRFNTANLALGSAIFIVGLFKKVVIADSLDMYVRPAFAMADMGQEPGFFLAWLGVFAFSLQVYFDFSGYTDMAIGAALVIGIHLPINFFSPYKAASIAELWRRWHMTLTRIIRECLFLPMSLSLARFSLKLSKNKWLLQLLANALPLTITFMLVGLWHGAGYNFLLFGLFHGVLLSIHTLWQEAQRTTVLKKFKIPSAIGVFLTILAWVWSLVLFRTHDLSAATSMYHSMLDFGALGQEWGRFLSWGAGSVLLIYILVLVLPNTEQLFRDYRPKLADKHLEKLRTTATNMAWRESVSWAVFMAVLFFAASILMTREVEFIYFQF